ncbi:MAG TPA: NHLP bacteriocin export ABC transporter permease/ATPase subunit [Chloroflexi bacterium]|nr:NHLP bacteriocin export ABC transporter permease/ATPase subunit [Chloroflexota bacterium]
MKGREDSITELYADPDFLKRLRRETDELMPAGGNRAFLLQDRQRVWVIYAGSVDVFAVPVDDGRVAGARRHVCRMEAGQALFGMALDATRGVGLLAGGVTGTWLLPLDLARLQKLAGNADDRWMVKALIDAWVVKLSAGIVTDVVPRRHQRIEVADALVLQENEVVLAKKGALWIRQLAGESHYLGRPDFGMPRHDGFTPLSPYTWLEAVSPAELRAVTTGALLEQGTVWDALDAFHQLALDLVHHNVIEAERAERRRLQKKAEHDRASLDSSLAQIAAVLEPTVVTPFVGDGMAKDFALLNACQLVGDAIGVKFQPYLEGQQYQVKEDALRNIARASRVRHRRVALRGAWWRTDSGPMLAFIALPSPKEEQPVALLPAAAGHYELVDPLAQTCIKVTPDVAATLSPFGYVFYRPFPDKALNALDLLKFGLRAGQRDLLVVGVMGLAGGLLATTMPLVTGILFDSVIPGAARGQLLQLGLALLVSAVAAAMFQLTQNIAMLRLEGRMDASIQAAVWDRLLSLPVPFFRGYSAGDLSNRAMGISAIRRTLSGTTILSVVSALFSVFNLLLLFYFDSRLAFVATALVVLAALVTGAAGYLQVKYQRQVSDIEGQIAGMVLQFLGGIVRFRVTGTEGRAFARWASAFSQQRRVAFKAQTVANSLAVFNTTYPVLTSAVIYAMIAYASTVPSPISTGAFLAFIAAFTQFLVASLTLTSAMTSILNIVPLYERARPILKTRPEVDPAKAHPGELRGEIEASHVAFGYKADEPPVLVDVSFRIQPGEFVALVGPSGSGKSTVMRLLIGFETPLSGSIYYDGQDLDGLDIEAVRRQIGVVLQNGRLIAGDIFTNIVGSAPLTLDDAWEAVRMVGLEDEIRQMPMGLHTVISEGGSNLSGGQRQRLLIARAIVNKPRILFFDEATSALDNRTQALVSKSLERLSATRVVVAHRLSTIINADRIFVIASGRVVQSGRYAELMREGGLFAELARRQLAS